MSPGLVLVLSPVFMNAACFCRDEGPGGARQRRAGRRAGGGGGAPSLLARAAGAAVPHVPQRPHPRPGARARYCRVPAEAMVSSLQHGVLPALCAFSPAGLVRPCTRVTRCATPCNCSTRRGWTSTARRRRCGASRRRSRRRRQPRGRKLRWCRSCCACARAAAETQILLPR